MSPEQREGRPGKSGPDLDTNAIPAIVNQTPVIGVLDDAERDELERLETVIEDGYAVFLKVGIALGRIRDQRLYRAEYATWDDYVNERWHMGRTRAYELISAAQITTAMSEISDTVPATESQAKALRGLEPEAAAEIIAEVADEGPVTAKKIRAKRKTKTKPVTPSQVITDEEAAEADRLGNEEYHRQLDEAHDDLAQIQTEYPDLYRQFDRGLITLAEVLAEWKAKTRPVTPRPPTAIEHLREERPDLAEMLDAGSLSQREAFLLYRTGTSQSIAEFLAEANQYAPLNEWIGQHFGISEDAERRYGKPPEWTGWELNEQHIDDLREIIERYKAVAKTLENFLEHHENARNVRLLSEAYTDAGLLGGDE